ncbi:Isoprenylcysteine carboxyl methyltransferase (ICMT) family protein [Aquisphaera giovannonii]|uniref:Isoprenylcysteine carboxyl methyltransferase (ICMT) family protein n=1 Tax=Aquisphaera giovannonii TaxID=406548 RepID=A0A5B9W6Q2_9BACT|nr:isoprenylcysteine carboxylmethyltransferase family protein [Aquisphaera giovannonii]QEH36007.1 Isoprenylcysteine carboxyl methyltransferase (ICMT) family protein [Aquisphaera giovannonii]
MQILLLSISGMTWAVFLACWLRPWADERGGTEGESPLSRAFHLFLFWTALALSLLISYGPLGTRWLPDWTALSIAGLVLQWISIRFAVNAREIMGASYSGRIAETDGQRLVEEGPFRVIRHPIYLGILGMFLGTALVSGERHGLLGLTLAAVAFGRKTYLEERGLSKQFGDAFRAYRGRTGLLFPRPWWWRELLGRVIARLLCRVRVVRRQRRDFHP